MEEVILAVTSNKDWYIFYLIIIGMIAYFVVVSRWNSKIEEDRRREELERQEAWMKSPEGIAHQKRMQEEEEKVLKLRKMEIERIAREKLEQEEMLARIKWNAFYESKTMDEIQLMTGLEFEKFIARILTLAGYTNVTLTSYTDQGGDIICESVTGKQVVVQVKRWSKPLGNKVIQEVFGAMKYYNCKSAMIVTNSRFTAKAQELAETDKNIILCDGKWLSQMITRHFPDKVPDFDWEIYNRDIKDKLVLSRFINTTSARSRARWRKRKRYRRWR